MIEFKGTTEKDWLSMQGHRIKIIIKKLNKYNEKKQRNTCPLLGSK